MHVFLSERFLKDNAIVLSLKSLVHRGDEK
jgi:hypothetical protein